MELLSISVGNQKCRVFQVVGHDVMMDMDALTTILLISKAFTEVLQTHMGWNSPNFADPALDPKTEGLLYQYFFGSESLQSLFVFLFPVASFSCFLKHLASHKACQGPIMLLIHSWADARCVTHLWLQWWWILAPWELWMWLFVTQGGCLSSWFTVVSTPRW